MEIEAKYKITGTLDPATISALDLTPYAVRAGEQLAHHDIMLDTPERAITGSRHSLRLRDENGTTILTFKGPDTVEGSIHRREEIEARLPASGTDANGAPATGRSAGGAYDYRTWPKKLAQRVEALVGTSDKLGPLIEVVVKRQTWIVERDGEQIGELDLDEGTILAGGASEPVHELELELKEHGTPDDLASLDARLQAALPLTPEPRSKLERGLALLSSSAQMPNAERETQSAMPTATTTKPDHAGDSSEDMTGHTPLQVAARAAVDSYLSKLRRNEPKVREGHDRDAVHDMRVATRRIRSTLQLLEDAPDFDAKHLRALRRHLRTLAHRLGAVRDLDVFLKHLEDYEHEHPGAKDGLHPLRHSLDHRRERARRKLQHELDGAKVHHYLDQVETFATQTPNSFSQPRPVLVRHFAGSALWRRYEDVLRFETDVFDAPARDLHKLRITCKRARYAVELFEPALGDGARDIENGLIAVQDHLGDLQDTVVALATVEEIRRSGFEHHHTHEGDGTDAEDTALADYADHLAARRVQLRETFPPLWERISCQSFRAHLAGLIAAL